MEIHLSPSLPKRPKVLVLASTFPSSIQPVYGVFVKERAKAVAALGEFDLRVVSPTPWFPPLKGFPKWYPLSQVPRRETFDGLDVLHPRYPLPPKVGGYFHARLMYQGVRATIRRMHAEFPFDLIDAHFVYPDGVVGAMLARDYGVPLVMTARGVDMIHYPTLPIIRDSIRWALPRAAQLVALSEELAQKMIENGASPERITVISNGVDIEKFRPVPIEEARRRLGLPVDRKIIVSVGNIQERKGFHLAVEALPAIRERHPDALLVIVGGPPRGVADYSPQIEETMRRAGVAEHVRLVGSKLPEELHLWYSSGDVFALLSSREGSPNVVMEALSCGVPTVGTPVGTIPQVLAHTGLGLVLPERSAAAAAVGLSTALDRRWDRGAIREWAVNQSWGFVALRVADLLHAALPK